jgi:hypothetical protein
MILFIFLAIQLAVGAAAAALLWRRIEQQRNEIASLKHLLASVKSAGAARRAAEARTKVVAIGGRAPLLATVENVAATVGPAPVPATAFSAAAALAGALPSISPETARGAALGLACMLPALAFPFAADHALVVACGLCIAAGMMLLAFDRSWRAAAWAGLVTGAVWVIVGFALHVAQAQPLTFSVALGLAGAASLFNARLREPGPGEASALIMAFAALVLGNQIGMIGPAGGAFGVMAAMAAIVGAVSLRLEKLHVAGFAATLIGLFVLSGQPSAAIWFTPVTTWTGALFLGVSAVRVPHLGARGVTLAATGALAPLLGIAALYDSHQGLADPRAAGGAFIGLSVMLGGVIAAAAQRHRRGLAALKITLWVLAASGFIAAVAGSLLAFQAPFAAAALGAIALSAALLFARFQDAVWRIGAVAAALLTAFAASASVPLILQETPGWSATFTVAGGLAVPAALAGVAGSILRRANARVSGSLAKLVAIGLSVATADMVLRLVFSGGAPLMQPVGFVEAGCHITAWLAIALAVAARGPKRRMGAARKAGILVLGAASLAASALIAALWLTPYWQSLIPSRAPWPALRFDGLGFLAPAALYWAHWAFWRRRGANVRTRAAFAAAAAMTGCFIALLVMKPGQPDVAGSIAPLLGAVSLALAILANFAPGVVAKTARRSYLQEDLHGDGRGQQRG